MRFCVHTRYSLVHKIVPSRLPKKFKVLTDPITVSALQVVEPLVALFGRGLNNACSARRPNRGFFDMVEWDEFTKQLLFGVVCICDEAGDADVRFQNPASNTCRKKNSMHVQQELVKKIINSDRQKGHLFHSHCWSMTPTSVSLSQRR